MTGAERLLAWLLTYAVHGTALLLLALVIARWIRSPAVRELVWRIALVGGLVTSLVQTLGVRPITARYQIQTGRPAAAVSERSRAEAVTGADAEAALARKGSVLDQTEAAHSGAKIDAPPAGVTTSLPRPNAATVVLGLWLLGAGGLVIGFARRHRELARRLGPRPRLTNHPMVAELAELRARFGVRREIVLTVSDRLASPIAIGLSEICVPAIALRELDEGERVGLLAHELAHLVRWDTIWISAAALIERVFFFQPLNRLARIRIQADAELLCDEWAAGAMGSGLTVARCLVKVAEWIDAAPRPIPVVGMAEERSELVDRVQRLVEEKAMSVKPRWSTVVLGTIGLVVATALVAPNVGLVGQDRGSRETRSGSDTTGTVVAALSEALKDPSVGVRRAAAQSLGNLSDRRAVPALIAAISDEDAKVRAAVTQALGELQDPRAVDALLGRFKDSSAEVRQSALQGLSSFDRETARVAWFRPWLDDPDPDNRSTAANALGELRDRSSVASLVKLLGDANANVRESAAGALGEIKDPAAIDPLTRAIKDPNPSVRERALDALSEFELTAAPAGVLEALADPRADVRSRAAHLVGHVGDPRAVGALRGLLTDPDKHVREAAVEALSEIRDQAAIDALVAALKSTDPVVRRAAAEALGQRKD